jgi:hypothetical protein
MAIVRVARDRADQADRVGQVDRADRVGMVAPAQEGMAVALARMGAQALDSSVVGRCQLRAWRRR